jgi:hypothetical protein
MWHFDIKLTLGRYGHLFPGAEAGRLGMKNHVFKGRD